MHARRFLNFAAAVAFATAAGAASAATLDFGGQSMGTSRAITLRMQATGLVAGDSVPFEVVSSNPEFAITQGACLALTTTTCNVTLTFTPTVSVGGVNGKVATSATVVVRGADPNDFYRLTLTGMAERSLVTHFYQQILQRQPDAAGKAFWESEASRMVGDGADLKEVWYAMSKAFASSPEAISKAGSTLANDIDYVDWLYGIYFNRDGDVPGITYWTGQLAQGLSREDAQLAFMLSPEFTSLSTALFGATTARPEVTLVGDFYRGLLGRLPEDTGLAYWVSRLRAAQCSGAAAVRAEADSISSLFLASAEYTQRARTNAQTVTDLYDSFLRRAPDVPGAAYWVQQLGSGALDRAALRTAFLSSPEFTARVDAVVAAGCNP